MAQTYLPIVQHNTIFYDCTIVVGIVVAVGIDTSQVVLVLAQILVVRKAETVLRLVGCVAAVQIEAEPVAPGQDKSKHKVLVD